MNSLSQYGTRPSMWVSVLGASSIALALGACAQNGMDNVKPTATTAYHSGEGAAPQPAPAAAPAPARE
jgi:hypothetical protein